MKFLLGFGIGFAGALLLAPARGDETRRKLMAKAQDVASTSRQKMDQTAQQIEQAAREKAGAIGSAVGRQAAEAVVESMMGKPVNPEPRTA